MDLQPYELLEFNHKKRLRQLYRMLRFPRLTRALFYLTQPLYLDHENSFNKSFRYGVLTLGAGSMPAEELRALRPGVKAIYENFAEAQRAAENDEPVLWTEWIINSEIARAFDVVPFCPEALNLFGNVRGLEYPPLLIAEAESQGTPVENCSAQKLVVGSWMLKQLPRPSVILGATHPCDTSISVYQTLEYLTGAPTFVFDCPYFRSDEALTYYEQNTWEMIRFLEKHLERKIDWDKLSEVLTRVNQTNEYLRSIVEMSRAIPCPSSMISLLFAWAAREIDVGSPHLLEMAEGLYKVVKDRFDRGQGVVKKERLRVIMWFPPMGFFTYLFKWMEDEFEAVCVADFIGYVSTPHMDTSSEKSMVRCLANSQLQLAMGRQSNGPIEYFTGELEKLIDEYSPDCMIFSGHKGCKHGWASLRIVKDFCRKKKLPSLYLDLDIMDCRHTSEQGIKDQVRAFFMEHGWA